MNHLEVICRDPLVARDGRPFDAGGKMRCVPWLLPSVVAGSLRTLLGKLKDPSFGGDLPDRLKQVSVHGFLPKGPDGLYFPKPEDCLARPGVGDGAQPDLLATRPVEIHPGQGCDLPEGNLRPVMLAATQSGSEFKPAPLPEWWPQAAMVQWLMNQPVRLDGSFLGKPLEDDRVHLEVQPETGAAEDGKIFSTASLALGSLPYFIPKNEEKKLLAVTYPLRILADAALEGPLATLDQNHPLGGESRTAHWRHTSNTQAASVWDCPQQIRQALQKNPDKIRLVLATPAIFKSGWRPGWLEMQDGFWQGTPPGLDGVCLRLVGASMPRWRAISGWSLAAPFGPKPTRRMVSAGAVYFFEKVTGAAEKISAGWLQPVADDAQDRRDGFGLALWGVW